MRAPEHPRAAESRAALADSSLLDSGREAEYDDIVSLAAEICDAPVALISFLDGERQWFKASIGVDQTETPVEQSICAHAIHHDGLFEIENTLNDPRTRDNPLCVSDPNLRFYAGAPLVTRDGLPLGTVCVLDTRPRVLTDLQRRTLVILADQVVRLIELRQSVHRQDMLRKEADHRVKNSLQSIASVARLQAQRTKNAETRAALDSLRGRIGVVAALHEALYRTAAGANIDLAAYLPRIGKLVEGAGRPGVSLTMSVEPQQVSSDTAAALAVVINEFAANSYKHAFPDGRAGRIRFVGECTPGGYRLSCSDDGVGMGEVRPSGLGLQILDSSVQQLGGAIEPVADAPGTTLVFRFPLTRPPGSLGGAAGAGTENAGP